MSIREMLERLTSASKNFFWAFLVADGMMTNIQITYHPEGEMEIRGLPWQGFSHVLLSHNGAVFQGRDENKLISEDIASGFQMCRLWDPRVVVDLISNETQAEPNRWHASYDIRMLTEYYNLHPQQVEWLRAQPDATRFREIEFSAEGGLLTEMTEEDFSGSLGKQITLQFGYVGLVPPFARRLKD